MLTTKSINGLNNTLKNPTIIISKRNIIAWALYDWAVSAFSTVVITFIFAAYFTSEIASNKIIGTKQWGYAMALAGIITVVLSPIFGAIADHSGRRKLWLAAFTILLIISSALLWYAKPELSQVHFTLACVIAGVVGIEISQVFYNALLPNVSPPEFLGRISGWGWGSGYLGGLIALSVCLFGFVKAEPSWLNTTTAEHVRICGPVVALWTTIFCLPLFFLVPDHLPTHLNAREAIFRGLKSLSNTLKTLPRQKNILLFLIGRMIYMDGLNTIFAFGGIYAAGTFGMTLSEVIEFGIIMNVAAGLGAAIFAWIDDMIGAKRTISIALIALLVLGTAIVLTHSVIMFWIFAAILSLFFGPVQAASRSLMARLSPPEKVTEMFGLYTFSGKVTAFIGPWLLGTITLYFNSQRAGIASVVPFFIIGVCVLYFVKEPQKLANTQASSLD